jgi:predicted nucleic acid-binding protein
MPANSLIPKHLGAPGVLALLNPEDDIHARAKEALASILARRAPLVSTSFVLAEPRALLGRRFGLDAVRRFREDFAPLIDVLWVDEPLHDAGRDLLLLRRTRRLSLVDAVPFVTMRRQNSGGAFAFEPHFEQDGVVLVR